MCFCKPFLNNLAEPPSGNDVDQVQQSEQLVRQTLPSSTAQSILRYRYSGNPQYSSRKRTGSRSRVPLDAKGNNYYDVTTVGILKGAPDRNYAMSMVEFLSVKTASGYLSTRDV